MIAPHRIFTMAALFRGIRSQNLICSILINYSFIDINPDKPQDHNKKRKKNQVKEIVNINQNRKVESFAELYYR